MNAEKIVELLSGRQTVSIPEIQVEFSCGYKEAKNTIQWLCDGFFIFPEPNGVDYPVNEKMFSKKDLSDDDVAEVLKGLNGHDVELLIALSKRKSVDEVPTGDFDEDDYEKLKDYGLIYSFCGVYFLSVNDETMKSFEKCFIEVPTEKTLRYIAYSIAEACANSGREPKELKYIRLIPNECKAYVRAVLKKGTRTKHKLKFSKQDCPTKDFNILRFDMIESFLKQREFETVEEYVAEAERELDVIMDSQLCDEVIKRIASDAVRELKDFTLENIKDIRKLLLNN